MSLREELDKIYAELPVLPVGKCPDKKCDNCECCTITACTTREKHNINHYIAENDLNLPFITINFQDGWTLPNSDNKPEFDFTNPDVRCGYLKDGRCAIYPVRPLICRIFGACKHLPCDFFPEEATYPHPTEQMLAVGFFTEKEYLENSHRFTDEVFNEARQHYYARHAKNIEATLKREMFKNYAKEKI